MTIKTPHYYHANTPRKLITQLRKCKWNQRELARQIGINVAYINALVKHGKEPSNPDIRAALFLPRKPRKPRAPQSARPPLPEHLQWWKKLPKEKRDHYIQYLREKRKAGLIA